MDSQTLNKYVDSLSIKYKLNKQEIQACIPQCIKRKLFLQKVCNSSKVNIDKKYIVKNNTVIGKVSDGDNHSLDVDDIEYFRLNNIKYVLPDTLYSSSNLSEDVRNLLTK